MSHFPAKIGRRTTVHTYTVLPLYSIMPEMPIMTHTKALHNTVHHNKGLDATNSQDGSQKCID